MPRVTLSGLCLILVCCLAIGAQAASDRLAPPLDKQRSIKSKSKSEGAEVLHLLQEVLQEANGEWRRRHYVSIRVNDLDAARDYGRIVIPYNHYYSSLSLDFANTLSPTGALKSVSSEAVQERVTGGGQDFYSDDSELVFSLPEIAPGAILEFQFSITSRELPFPALFSRDVMPYWFQRTAGNDSWRADLVHHFDYRLRYPAGVDLVVKHYAGFQTKEKIQQQGEMIERRWSATQLPAQRSEGYMPRAEMFLPHLRYSSLRQWSDVDAWAWRNSGGKLASSDAIARIAASLPRSPAWTAEDKVRAVYAYVQENIRYVFAHLGRGGYEPHLPDQTLNVRYGDCKDQTVLAVALLRQLGVQAYPALIQTPRAGDSDSAIVDLIFDHMIVHIPAQPGLQTQWLDTTGDRVLYPGIANFLAGQNVLIVNGEGGQLTEIDAAALAPNKVVVAIDYSVDAEDRMVAELRVRGSGSYEQNARAWLTYNNDRDNSLHSFFAGFFNSSLEYDLSTQFHHSEALFEPVVLEGKFVFKNNGNKEQHVAAASWGQLLTPYLEPAGMQAPATRVNHYYDPYAITLELQATFDGGDRYRPALVQSFDGIKTAYFSTTQSGENEQGVYRVNLRFSREALNLSPQQYAQYHEQLNGLLKQKIWLVSFLPDKSRLATSASARVARDKGENSVDYQIALAIQYLDEGNIDAALKSTTRAVALDQNNGQAWYLHGTAQGLAAEFDASLKSFARAEALGYFP